jgi:hypothetical protein
VAFDEFIKNKKNVYGTLADRAKSQLGPTTRVFVIMPIQGEKYGDQINSGSSKSTTSDSTRSRKCSEIWTAMPSE